LIGKQLAVLLASAGAWGLRPISPILAGHNRAMRSVNSVTGEVIKTFPEHTKEQIMNAHKNCCVLRSLAAQGVI
jgi:acyl-CoA reductase-like NAD-dependent aldehyde dehydrogenase